MSVERIHPTGRFSSRVENYVRYRPDYPYEIIELMVGEMGLNENSLVADIGSGTGIFTKLLLGANCTVYGVEPNRAMRQAGDEFLKDFPKFKSVNGTAENTNLPAESIDYITSAQAFHWFDPERAKQEFRRILRPEGYIVLVWNERKLDADTFSSDYGRFLIEQGDDYENIRKSHAHKATIKKFFNDDFTVKSYSNVQTLDYEGLKGRTLSSSYMPSEQDARFPAMIEALGQIFARHNDAGKVKIYYDTKVFYRKF
jgi:ubiquinone/menaquinone biosynthesis C-methylase UbiE